MSPLKAPGARGAGKYRNRKLDVFASRPTRPTDILICIGMVIVPTEGGGWGGDDKSEMCHRNKKDRHFESL